ncbi:undecaprenyl-phosphate glucose phosphotransferase [Marinicrinis sediminis]|uniref:Undecaprenyl-phosphate glucose phosphotransferase n=1 Tax=Marinicrinis sediminis TaxID=1652465 RepID=A0ABW5RAP7_9BACL
MIRQSSRFLSQIYALVDFIAIQFIFLLAWWLKFKSGFLFFENPLPFSVYFAWSVVYGIIAVVTGFLVDFYLPKRKRRFSYELYKIIQVHVLSFLVLLSLLFFVKQLNLSRQFLGMFLTGNILIITIYRYVLKVMLRRARVKGYNKQFVLILGAGSLGKRFYHNLSKFPELGYEVVGFLDDYAVRLEEQGYPSLLGKVDELSTIIEEELIDEVVVALPLEAHYKYGQIIEICEKSGVKVLIIPDYYDYLPARPYFTNFAGIPLISVRDIPLDELKNRFLKRAFDIGFSLAAIIVTLPLLIMIAIGVKTTSRGSVFFRQERVGHNRRKFHMLKFRTMKIQTELHSDTKWTVENDPRVTRFGTLLRKTSLDELPQFFNVLLGNMSVVGPRPERPYFVDQFKEEIPKYMVKHQIRPGITGWAQSNGFRGDTSIEERIQYDLFYIENWSFLFDVRIICKTIRNGFRNRNAY